MKKIVLIILIINSLFGEAVNLPDAVFKADGAVTDIVYHDSKLYAATAAGAVNIFDMKTQKKIQTISLPKVKNFVGREINAKVYSVDVLDKKILLLSQAKHGYREVFIFEDSKLTKVITLKEKLAIAKAKFLDKDNIILALLGNDIISYNIKEHKKNWTKQASQSKFSNFTLKKDKTKIVVADESGELQIYNTKSSKHIKTLSGQNLDNVFAVDYKNEIIATAGQDRRVVVYDLAFNSAYYKTSSFLIYGVGLSPSAKLVAYSSDEKNNVTVFKTSTKSNLGVYGGTKMTLSKILFISETEFFVASDDKNINLYKIK
jgi:WD40 repeat protein